MIAVVDYGAGNLKSVVKAFEAIDDKIFVFNELDNIPRAPAIAPLVVVFISSEYKTYGKKNLGFCWLKD